jgi:hypothetical protein
MHTITLANTMPRNMFCEQAPPPTFLPGKRRKNTKLIESFPKEGEESSDNRGPCMAGRAHWCRRSGGGQVNGTIWRRATVQAGRRHVSRDELDCASFAGALCFPLRDARPDVTVFLLRSSPRNRMIFHRGSGGPGRHVAPKILIHPLVRAHLTADGSTFLPFSPQKISRF